MLSLVLFPPMLSSHLSSEPDSSEILDIKVYELHRFIVTSDLRLKIISSCWAIITLFGPKHFGPTVTIAVQRLHMADQGWAKKKKKKTLPPIKTCWWLKKDIMHIFIQFRITHYTVFKKKFEPNWTISKSFTLHNTRLTLTLNSILFYNLWGFGAAKPNHLTDHGWTRQRFRLRPCA